LMVQLPKNPERVLAASRETAQCMGLRWVLWHHIKVGWKAEGWGCGEADSVLGMRKQQRRLAPQRNRFTHATQPMTGGT